MFMYALQASNFLGGGNGAIIEIMLTQYFSPCLETIIHRGLRLLTYCVPLMKNSQVTKSATYYHASMHLQVKVSPYFQPNSQKMSASRWKYECSYPSLDGTPYISMRPITHMWINRQACSIYAHTIQSKHQIIVP